MRAVPGWLLLLAGLLQLASPCPAQNAPAPLDAVVLVAPLGNPQQTGAGSQTMVALALPKTARHSDVRQRMMKLAAAGGWQVVAMEITDRKIESEAGRTVTQTEATAVFSGPPSQREGGFALQPYAEAFRDLEHYQVLFMVQHDPAFRGLRRFEHAALTVALAGEAGPYDYRVRNLDRTVALPELPLVQAQPGAQPGQAQGGGSRRATGIVLIAAGLVGLVVLPVLVVRMRASGPRP